MGGGEPLAFRRMMTARHDSHVTTWVKQRARQWSSNAIADGYKPQALHEYTDTGGNPLHYRIRLKHPETGEKRIRPLMRTGAVFELKQPNYPNGTPPYRLHELAARPSEIVHIVEGETCVDALAKRGMLSTTSGGADSAAKADWSILAGRSANIWPDNDEAGQRYAESVKLALQAIGCTVSIIDVAALNLPPKGDCVDWLAMNPNASAADILALPKIDPSESTESDDQGAVEAKTPTAPPEPLPELPGVLSFDYDYLPGGLRGFVRDISERMQCPPDFAAVGAFVMMATIIGRKVGIRPMRRNDWTVIPNLWGAVVGNSGVMKSPTLSAALSPVKKLQAREYEVFNAAMALYAEQAEITKLQKTVKKAEAKKTLTKNNSADVSGLLKPDVIEDAPTLKRFITNNASYEALGELLMENPNGLLVEADEIIGLLKQLDAGGQEVARSFYLTAADGDKGYTFDRILRGKGLHIPALCLSIIGGIQPGVLAEYVRQATGGGAGADGLLQRFGLMVYPDISPDWREVDRYPDSEARAAVNLLAEQLDGMSPEDMGAETDPYGGSPFLRFDEAAQELFSEWRTTLEHRLRSGEEHPAIVSHLSKYRKLIPSLALINHLCGVRQGAVNEAALLRAIAFGDYLESHARRIYSYATRPDIDAAKTLLKRLAGGKLPIPFKARDIYIKGWTGLETPQKAQAALDLLREYNHLSEYDHDTGGRPTRMYLPRAAA